MIHLLPDGCKYINIPKCGSSSVREALGVKCVARGYRSTYIPFDGSKYVTIVRDPLERFVSCITYLNRWLIQPEHEPFSYATWIKMDGKYPEPRMEEHLRPQIKFIHEPEKFYKIYDLSEINQFFSSHGLKPFHKNAARTNALPITNEVIEWVHFKYSEDYKMLGKFFKTSGLRLG